MIHRTILTAGLAVAFIGTASAAEDPQVDSRVDTRDVFGADRCSSFAGDDDKFRSA